MTLLYSSINCHEFSLTQSHFFTLIPARFMDLASAQIVFYYISLSKFNSVETRFHYSAACDIKIESFAYLYPWCTVNCARMYL